MSAHRRESTYFIDTNIFLRVFVKENETVHHDCVELMRCIETNKIKAYTSSIVLAEIHHVLKSVYHTEKTVITRALQSITGISNLSIIDDTDISVALFLYTSHSVKFTDCLIGSSRFLQNHGKIISYDTDFDTLQISRIEPQSLL